MKYNELPHVLEHNKKQAAKHKGETIASLRVELATLRTQQAELVKALEELYKAAWSEEKDGKENYIFNLRRLSNAADRAEKILAQYKGDA